MELKRSSTSARGRVGVAVCLSVIFLCSLAFSQLEPNDVLILVNQNSPTSKYIAKLYRQYHPDVPANQVLYLSGLTDCSGPLATAEDEIITRADYDVLIAQPVRDFLTTSGLTTKIKVIITTAGIPYRIEDSNPAYADAVYPGGSNPLTVSNNLSRVDIASVESELTCLWYGDAVDNPFGLENRLVNPYQAYRQSSITLFERLYPGSKEMTWENPYTIGGVPPKMEGERWWSFPPIYGTVNRSMNAGDIYLVGRLDGPKNQGKSAISAVHAMLERAKRASNLNQGVNPAQAVVVIDDVPDKNLDQNRIYNLDGMSNYIIYDAQQNQPPDVWNQSVKYDYMEDFSTLTNGTIAFDDLSIDFAEHGHNTLVMLDRRNNFRTNQADLDNYAANDPNRDIYQGIIALATYGYNGDEGSGEHYLLEDGPSGGDLFNCVNGAVFTSIESLNAVTMFSDVSTLPSPHHQGKIVDFIEMGGTAAIGHAFEPVVDAVVDNMFLHYNLLADEDGDGYADLTFIEAAYTAIPYLSWSEVVIGDPLMRIAYGPGGRVWTRLIGDANNDGRVNAADIWTIKFQFGGVLNTSNTTLFDRYNDLCDINKDGRINSADIWAAKANFGAIADWR